MVRQWQIVAPNENSSCKLFLPKKYQLKYDMKKSDINNWDWWYLLSPEIPPSTKIFTVYISNISF